MDRSHSEDRFPEIPDGDSDGDRFHASSGSSSGAHGTNGHGANGHGANGHGANGNGTKGRLPGIPIDDAGRISTGNGASPGHYGPVCRVCPIRSSCRAICELVEAVLPSMERGRVDAEDLPRLFAGVRMRRALLDHVHILTPRQQEVVHLYYRDSLMQEEIAARLGVTQQAVHDSLRRARHAVGQKILHGSVPPGSAPRGRRAP